MAREFTSLSDKQGVGKIYKLVGPVLLAQDKSEAVMAVQARLEFIEKEMYAFFFFFLASDDDYQKGLTLLLAFLSRLLPNSGYRVECRIGVGVDTGPPVEGERGKQKKKYFCSWYSVCLLMRPLCGV